MIKYLASIPVVLSLLAGAYGASNYVSKLNNTVEQNTTALALLKVELGNTDENLHSEIDKGAFERWTLRSKEKWNKK